MPDVDDREIWYLPSPSGEGTLVYNAHPAGACAGGGCALHGPSDHWARDMPMRWRWNAELRTGFMERDCPHGVFHDDPDDLAFRRLRGMPTNRGVKHAPCDCPCDCDHDVPF